jgi:putative endonuclease
MKQFYVYILASRERGTLYIGFTSDLIKRVYEHKNGLADSFTKKHSVKMLVYYEVHDNFESAVTREKRLKKWNRAWKIELIENFNQEWKDLYDSLI